MHHLGYVFQQFWNDDEEHRKRVRRRARRRSPSARTGKPRRSSDSL